MNPEVRKRIDAARDTLVGKVANPLSQVEQITFALMYRYMDLMDRMSEDVGGSAHFFANGYEKYAWGKVVDPKLGGHERRDLYSEALERMSENPHLPGLFRTLFRDAALPYRDTHTLNLFLKEISAFPLEHTEELGDAYEYLLSIMSSQGKAGQFRTPRHIIDFIVKVVDPKKGETILDPACGTAGFLIHAYQHIVDANTETRPGDLLTGDEREQLARDVVGYDIAPEMVRLSLVNLYMHGFSDPAIHEYDTLTSEARWADNFDVILANPPFMTPKGGIKPHGRFGVKCNRSEVLFVDYIAGHLTADGRAGIIVPEGIIFQSSNAYKQLRKMLVESYLVAVVSLPAGVFNPYAGVKTSVLILDRELARQSDSVLFVKVENDGFSLGANRTPIAANDLPQALAAIREYFERARAGEAVSGWNGSLSRTATREAIAATGDFTLSGERYSLTDSLAACSWPTVRLGDVCRQDRRVVARSNPSSAALPYVGMEDVEPETGAIQTTGSTEPSAAAGSTAFLFDQRHILYGKLRPYLNKVALPGFQGRCSTELVPLLPDGIDRTFLAHLLRSPRVVQAAMSSRTGSRMPRANLAAMMELPMPLPPLDVQRAIVAEIEGYQKVIDGARQVIDNWKPSFTIDPSWPLVKLGEVIAGKPRNGYSGKPVPYATDVRVLTLTATTSGSMDLTKFKYLDEAVRPEAECRCRRGDIYLQRGNTKDLVGTAAVFESDDDRYIYPDLMIRVRADETKIHSAFLLAVLSSAPVRRFIKSNATGAAGSMPKISQGIVERIPLPLPPLDVQLQIVRKVEAERVAVTASSRLVDLMEARTKAKMDEVWGVAAPGREGNT